MDDKKHLQHSRKMRNIEKMIKKLHDQRRNNQRNVQQYGGEYQLCRDDRSIQNMLQQQQNDQNLFLSQEQQVDYHLFIKTIESMQTLIETNQLNVQSLERKNQLLIKHMGNLKNLFSKSQAQIKQAKDLADHDHEVRAGENKQHQSIPSWKKYPSKQHEQSKKHANIAKKSSKTTQNDTIWQNERQNVKMFLHSWLKKNIKQNNSSSAKIIQKRIILHLYLKWKEVQNLRKNNLNELSQAQIQQILTIEMRSAFNCTCTTRGYEGIAFIKRHQTHSPSIQVQKERKSTPSDSNNNRIHEIQQLNQQPDKDCQEQFSYEIQSQQEKYKEDQGYY